MDRRNHSSLSRMAAPPASGMVQALEDLMHFTGHSEMLTEFDGELVGRFVDRITVYSQTEVTFHLKCGLSLRERIG